MKNKLGIALSGGGFRAAAFHLGTLRKLKQLGLLDKVDVMSTVSGGSITGASYALNKDDFKTFEKEFRAGLKKSMLTSSYWVIGVVGSILLSLPFVLAYFGWYLLFLYLPIVFLFLKYQFNLLPFGRLIERRYNKVFYKCKTLKNLPEKPLLAVNSTNIETGRPFTFSREKMNDSLYEYPFDGSKRIRFKHEMFPVSRAVMASSCVPFAFTPVKIHKEFYKNYEDFKLINPTLIDGGVYDNQGVHKLTHNGSMYECNTIIVSDAGTGFKPITTMNNTLMLLMQTSELFMNRIKNVQFMNNVILNKYLGSKSIAYLSLAYDPESCLNFFADYALGGKLIPEVLKAHGLSEELLKNMSKESLIEYMAERISYKDFAINFPSNKIQKEARNVGTNLTALKDEQIDALVAVAESLTELQVKLYCPGLI